MCSGKMKFGVAMLALVGLGFAAGSAQAALILYDDFNDAGVSATKWTKNEASPGTVTFDGTTAILDMPAGPTARTGKNASMDSTLAMQLSNNGDFFRLTWDVTPTFGTFAFFGARFGGPADDQKFMAVMRHTGVNRFRAFSPQVTTDGSVSVASGDALHYDVTATMTDAANNLAEISLAMYTRNLALDTNPDGYSGETPLETLNLVGATINAGQSNIIGIFAQPSVNDAGDVNEQNRGSGVFDNVYSEAGRIPEPASLVLFGLGLISMVGSRRRLS